MPAMNSSSIRPCLARLDRDAHREPDRKVVGDGRRLSTDVVHEREDGADVFHHLLAKLNVSTRWEAASRIVLAPRRQASHSEPES